MKVTSAVCSFIYYFTDNIVWLAKIGFVSKYIPLSDKVIGKSIKWGKIKDQFSLVKTILELVIYTYVHRIKTREIEELRETLLLVGE
jgi:hypothetical protein